MTHKERYDQLNPVMPDNLQRTPEQVIENIVNQLIDALYIPLKCDSGITRVDPKRLDHFTVDGKEPINWGDLKCIDVEQMKSGKYKVTIDEAAPEDCPTFCQYIEEYMLSYGWSVRVITEW